jgi:phenylpropionate dioxygenase-like ring-hydroxylating dioxygenase large terminal subunit
VPYADGYPQGLDREEFGLIKLRTEVYQGMIFATFKEISSRWSSSWARRRSGWTCS